MKLVSSLLRASMVAMISVTLLTGCQMRPAEPPLTQLQLRQLQSRTYDNKELKVAMRAVINALLDEGFIIKNADKDLGFVQATREEDLNGGGGGAVIGWGGLLSNNDVRWRNSSVIDASGTLTNVGRSINVRLIFQKKVLDNYGVSMGVNVITDPNFYQNIFAKIDKSLFLEKEGLVGR